MHQALARLMAVRDVGARRRAIRCSADRDVRFFQIGLHGITQSEETPLTPLATGRVRRWSRQVMRGP